MTDETNLKDFNKELNEVFDDQTFGFRDNYIITGINKSINFTVFITKENIGLKYPFKNISQKKIEALSILINEININFTHRKYSTTQFNKYSIWEIYIKDFNKNQIYNLIKKIKKHNL
ncbi:hypothetical protein [Flavobacterium sp. LB2P53]|uniref:hypothetical protein n=1 Tax=Flavobacterium sp. LB2P53 TaxID=2497481 RepID=UPI000F83BC5B|nr:hypothetical protein [Flavobacterium sp. LB2P53]RTY70575.1 hypothetical protein EKL95_04290 [Flavobacterium sp. LB2P53]